MGIAVYIATTAGPIRIERIVGEDVPQSNVFVGRDYKPIEPLSSDYQAFVAPGGPVDVAFGPFETPSSRLDVSGPISTGNSWELATFIAHGLAKHGQLAGPDEVFEMAILLSGRVDTDLSIGSVGHIDKKVNSAAELIADCESLKCPVIFFHPFDDQVSLPGSGSLSLRPVTDAMNIMAYLGEYSERDSALSDRPELIKTKAVRDLAPVLTLWLSIIFVIGVGGYVINKGWDSVRDAVLERAILKDTTNGSNGAEGIVISVFESRPLAGNSCIDVHFSEFPAREVKVEAIAGGAATTSKLAEICGIRVAVESALATFKGVAKMRVLSGRYMGMYAVENSSLFEGFTQWILPMPSRLDTNLKISVSAGSQSGEGEAVSIEHYVIK